jgi:hypothetical protein
LLSFLLFILSFHIFPYLSISPSFPQLFLNFFLYIFLLFFGCTIIVSAIIVKSFLFYIVFLLFLMFSLVIYLNVAHNNLKFENKKFYSCFLLVFKGEMKYFNAKTSS